MTALCAAIFAAQFVWLDAFAAEPDCAVPEKVFSEGARLSKLQTELRLKRPLDVLAIGSSSTAGVGASSPNLTYPAQLQAELAVAWPTSSMAVVNAGVSGETVEATVSRFEAAAESGRHDLILWQVGTNDAVRGADES